MTNPAVCVIITAWNEVEKTLACLETAVDQTYPNYTILLVDNGSQQPLIQAVVDQFPQVETLRNERNLGFAGGYNQGLLHALLDDFDLFFLLNNDTLLAPDCLEALVAEYLAAPDVGLVTAKIYYAAEPKRIWTVGNALSPWVLDIKGGGDKQIDTGQWENPRDIDFVPFCSVLLSRTVLEDVGLLDEDFFLYYEDMDYCRRARLAGFRLRYAPRAKLWHLVSASSGGRDSPLERYWMAQSSGRYFRKHGRGWHLLLIIPFRLASALKMTLHLLFKRRGRALVAYWLGLLRGWSNGRAITPPPEWVTPG